MRLNFASSKSERSFKGGSSTSPRQSFIQSSKIPAIELEAETLQLIGKPHACETRNPLITNEASEDGSELLSGGRRSSGKSSGTKGPEDDASVTPISSGMANTPDFIPEEISNRGNSTPINTKSSPSKTSSDCNPAMFKNDKKLTNVLTVPMIVEEKSKRKSYLERYREKIGVTPTKKTLCSPEGSTLSIFGDTSREPLSEVDSRPPTTTPRDDQSELSFYRQLIDQPRTTRSWDVQDRFIAKTEFRSISDYGLTSNAGRERISYRPYSIKDYECLTVPRADRSLGPDTYEIREKLEKLMRRTHYGDLASSRNRRNVVRRSQLRKCERSNVKKQTVESLPTKNCDVAGKAGDSKNLGDKNQPTSPPKRILTGNRSLKYPKSSTTSSVDNTGRKSTKSLILSVGENTGNSSLEDLQRRHQNEKRVMDQLINRTLLR